MDIRYCKQVSCGIFRCTGSRKTRPTWCMDTSTPRTFLCQSIRCMETMTGCTHTSSDRSTSRYVPIHLQTGLPQGMYPYIFRQVYLKVCTNTSSNRSTSRYVPIHLQTGLPQSKYPYIFRQVYLKVSTHTSSDRSTSK